MFLSFVMIQVLSGVQIIEVFITPNGKPCPWTKVIEKKKNQKKKKKKSHALKCANIYRILSLPIELFSR